MKIKSNYKGFTLIEMAIVLVIIGLLIAGLLEPLGVQRDVRDYTESRAVMSDYKEALIGYALTQTPPHLPCPDVAGGDGLEEARDVNGACTVIAGEVPWATLGLPETDSWNNTYLYRVTPAFSDSDGFTLATVGDNDIFNSTPVLPGGLVAENVPFVILSKGRGGFGSGDDESENDLTDENFVSHDQVNVTATAFDDIVVWVPATILFNRMVTAGNLP